MLNINAPVAEKDESCIPPPPERENHPDDAILRQSGFCFQEAKIV